jgi:hypothetical protein
VTVRRSVAVLVGALAASLVWAPTTPAMSRPAAERIAMRVLAPERLSGDVVLFGLPRPLRAGAVVNEQGTGARLSRLRSGKSWLFWLDLEPGASFDHASRVLLVADANGKVLANRPLRRFPLVDGRPPAFLSSAAVYWDDRLQVFSNVPTVERRAPARSIAPQAAAGIPPEALVGECILLVVHTPASPIEGHAAQEALRGWIGEAARLGIPAFVATRAGPADASLPGIRPPAFEGQVGERDLIANVRTLVDEERCRDIAIYVLGHGTAPPGLADDSGQPVPGGPPAIETGVEELTADERAAGKRPRARRLRLEGLEALLRQNVGKATFKLVLESCYADRFTEALVDEPNVKIVLASAGEQEAAMGWLFDRTDLPRAEVANPGRPEFTHGLLTGIDATLANGGEVDVLAGLGDSLLARLLKAGFDKEAVNDRAAKGGLTHPVEANTLAPPPFGFGPTTHQHRPGDSTIICGTVTGAPGRVVRVRLTHLPTGNSAPGSPRAIGPAGSVFWGFTLSEHGAFRMDVLVDDVVVATTGYTVPDPPEQGPFACTSG